MKTIAIIGANGQVGTEVALYLSQYDDVKVVAICRTEPAAAFLMVCGIECRCGSIEDSSVRELLAGCDTIADFTLPRGTASEVKTATRSIMHAVFTGAPPHATVIYISTTVAYGIGPQAPDYRSYAVATTPYGIIKRYGERLATRLGKKTRRPTFVLRLGQVNGDLQAPTLALLRGLTPGEVYVPDCPSDTVFAFSIAEAISKIAAGVERPGLYTLVSSPEWSWEELYKYYCASSGIAPQVNKMPYPPYGRLGWWYARASASVRFLADRGISTCRGIVQGYMLSRFPAFERRLTMRYRQNSVQQEIAALEVARQRWPFLPTRGRVPGRRLETLSDSRVTMPALRDRVLAVVNESTRRMVDPEVAWPSCCSSQTGEGLR